MERTQMNFRLDQSLIERIDGKRVELREKLGTIPSRSDVLRMALEEFLANIPESSVMKTRKAPDAK